MLRPSCYPYYRPLELSIVRIVFVTKITCYAPTSESIARSRESAASALRTLFVCPVCCVFLYLYLIANKLVHKAVVILNKKYCNRNR